MPGWEKWLVVAQCTGKVWGVIIVLIIDLLGVFESPLGQGPGKMNPPAQKKTVVYVDDIPTPYRVGVHQRVRERGLFEYHVLFCAAEEPGRQWNLDLQESDELFTVLEGKQYRPAGQLNPFSFKFNFSVLAALKRRSPDVVILSGYAHPTMWLAAYWCLRHRIRFGITTESSSQTTSRNPVLAVARQLVVRLLFSKIHFGLAVSQRAGHDLRTLVHNDQLPVFPFPNTPDVDQIERILETNESVIAARSGFNVAVSADDVVIVFVGRLIEAKRPMDLLSAVAGLPVEFQQKLKIFFLGEGPLKPLLAQKAQGLTAAVNFCGWIADYEQNITLIASSDLMVLPSQHEPWGAVVNEGMAAGTCVIASDHVGAAQDMITHSENGFVFPMGDVDALRAIVQNAMTEADLPKISAAARLTAKRYGSDLAIESVCRVVGDVARA